MSRAKSQNAVKLQAKRNVELWIYSFADMYMILSVFFIALSVLYAAKMKQDSPEMQAASAGRGPASIESMLGLAFQDGSAELNSNSISELQLFLPVLKSAPDSNRIMIEGFASGNEPLDRGTGFTSRLDLSSRRAVSVAEWLVKNGIRQEKMQTFSFGDGLARKRDTDIAGSDSQRVIIKLASWGDR